MRGGAEGGGDVKKVHVENELKRYKRRVRQIAHMRLIDKAYPGKMRKTIVWQALPGEHRDSGEWALIKKWRPLAAGILSLSFQTFRAFPGGSLLLSFLFILVLHL